MIMIFKKEKVWFGYNCDNDFSIHSLDYQWNKIQECLCDYCIKFELNIKNNKICGFDFIYEMDSNDKCDDCNILVSEVCTSCDILKSKYKYCMKSEYPSNYQKRIRVNKNMLNLFKPM